jgi:phosphoglycerate dehydrogenase-like enzyme
MKDRKKVILDPYRRTLEQVIDPTDLSRLEELVQLVWCRDEPMPQEEFDKEKGDAFAVVTGRWRYGGVEDMTKLRAIMEVSGGHPSPEVLDYESCFRRGVRVLSCAPAFGPMVAEMALGMAIDAARGISEGDRAFRAGEEKWKFAGNVGNFTLYDQRVGFVGYGGLGRSLRALLEPFRCDIMVYDPWLPDRFLRQHGLEPVPLDDLLRSSKVIFVLSKPSKENRGEINRERLGLIGPGSVMVLMSRAYVVDFDAFTEFAGQGRFRAAMDVFSPEPPPQDHPIRSIPGVVLSAHRAGTVERDFKDIGRMVVDDLEAMVEGMPPQVMKRAEPEIIRRLR